MDKNVEWGNRLLRLADAIEATTNVPAVMRGDQRLGDVVLEVEEAEALVAEIDRLRTALAATEKDRDHWRANHDNQVAIKRTLLDRPDLGDRAQSVQALVSERDRLRAAFQVVIDRAPEEDPDSYRCATWGDLLPDTPDRVEKAVIKKERWDAAKLLCAAFSESPSPATEEYNSAAPVVPAIRITADTMRCLAKHGTAFVDGVELAITSGVPDERILAAVDGGDIGPVMPEEPMVGHPLFHRPTKLSAVLCVVALVVHIL